MNISRFKKFFSNHKQYKIIKKLNKQNIVSYNSAVDEKTFLEGNNYIENASIKGTFMGAYSYCGKSYLNNCKIGRFTSISRDVVVVSPTHPLDFVSTFPGFYNSQMPRFPFSERKFNEFLLTEEGYECEIGNDVWIGRNVLIKGGIHIGDGAVIGMGSIVTKDIPPYSIVTGVPARVIRYRFSQDIISKLLKIQWWNWDYSKISEQKNLFADIDKFISMNAK